jgi:hypothetical protein
MNKSVSFLGLVGLGSAGLLIAVMAVWTASNTAEAQTADMKIVPAGQTVDLSGGTFTLEIVAEQVDDPNGLAAFEFKLMYDPDIIRFVGVEAGPFLASTGRDAHCVSARHRLAGSEDIQFGCATIAQGPPWGPNGSGLLATVTFAPRAAGTTSLNMTPQMAKVIPLHGNLPDESIAVLAQGGSVTVVGAGPEPTPEPDEPTPMPVMEVPSDVPPAPTPSTWLTPEPGATPMTLTVGSAHASGTTGNPGDSSDPASQGRAGGSPRAGEGPGKADPAWWPPLAAGLLAIAGASLLPFALYLRGAGAKRRI